MSMRQLRFSRRSALPSWLFNESAGVQLSGDSGSGKSNALEGILEGLLRHRDVGFTFIDPHGSSARKLRRMAVAIGPSVARRVVYLHPCAVEEGGKLFSINPLFVPGDPRTFRWQSRLAVTVEIVAKILLAAWGETDFDGKPVLFKNVVRILTTLGYTGLSLADAKLFLDLHSPVYRPLVQACPDLIARHEMQELPDLRVAERQAQIESAKNRFLGLLSNPLFEAIVSRSVGALNFQQLYDDRAIVIVNLELGGVLRAMDQEILANLFLTQAIFTILNAPPERRYPYFLAVDELPVFKSSFDLLLWLSGQVRKFLARLVVCHQGVNLFPERGDDRLLQALTSQCRTHFFFRHGSPADAEFFGRILALPEYDPKRVKHIQRVPTQFQVGHRLAVLCDESEGSSHTSGDSETSGTSESTTNTVTNGTSQGDSRTLVEAVERARTEASSRSRSQSDATGQARQASSTSSRSTTQNRSRTLKQQLVPVLETRSIVTAVQFFTKEELEAVKARDLSRLPTGMAMLYVTGTPAVPVQFPLAVDPFERTPKFGAKKIAEHQAQQERQPAFATLAQMRAEHDELLEALLAQLHALTDAPDGLAPAPLLALSAAPLDVNSVVESAASNAATEPAAHRITF
jgi:hypothetical protein